MFLLSFTISNHIVDRKSKNMFLVQTDWSINNTVLYKIRNLFCLIFLNSFYWNYSFEVYKQQKWATWTSSGINSGVDTFFQYSLSEISKLIDGITVELKCSWRRDFAIAGWSWWCFFHADLTSVNFMIYQKRIDRKNRHACVWHSGRN